MIETINSLPDDCRSILSPHLDAVMDDCARRIRILSIIQDTMGQLRLDTKYLMFDLEATRRERDAALEKLT